MTLSIVVDGLLVVEDASSAGDLGLQWPTEPYRGRRVPVTRPSIRLDTVPRRSSQCQWCERNSNAISLPLGKTIAALGLEHLLPWTCYARTTGIARESSVVLHGWDMWLRNYVGNDQISVENGEYVDCSLCTRWHVRYLHGHGTWASIEKEPKSVDLVNCHVGTPS